MTEQTTTTRRGFARKIVAIGGATVATPAFVDISAGATDSGNIELTTTSTIPTDTGIDVTIYEDSDADGNAERNQTKSLSGGTGEITEYETLQGKEGAGNAYWMDIALTSNDTEDQASGTPELDSAEITLPALDSGTGETEGAVEIEIGYTCPNSDTEILLDVREFTPNGNLNATVGFRLSTFTDSPFYYPADSLDGTAEEGWGYEVKGTLQTEDITTTPSLNYVTVETQGEVEGETGTATTTTESPITVPPDTTTTTTEEEFAPTPTTVEGNQTTSDPINPPGGSGGGITDLIDNNAVFILASIFGMGAVGLSSRSMAIAAWAAYITFAYLGLQTGFIFLENLVYATLVLVFVAIGWKVWKLEGGGGT